MAMQMLIGRARGALLVGTGQCTSMTVMQTTAHEHVQHEGNRRQTRNHGLHQKLD